MTVRGTATVETPKRASRLTDEQVREIVRLDLRQVSEAEIARRLNISRKSVRRALDRMRATLAIAHDLSVERAKSIATYLEVQRAAWQAVEDAQRRGRSPALLLAEVRLCQARIDAVMGLAPDPDAPLAQLHLFRQIVFTVIQREAPELAPRIARGLIDAGEEAGNA